MVAWLVSAGAVIIVAVATALWWWGLTSWLVPVSAAVVIAVAELWWWVPRWQANSLRVQVRDAKARADLEDSFRKTIGQLFGGAAVLIGAWFGYFQFLRQQEKTDEQIRTSRDQIISQQRASHDQLISQQVSKGFELLGHQGADKLVVRLGGIYALEGVMNTSDQYHMPVLEALCAFVRDGTKPQATPAKPVQGKASKPSPGNSTPEPSPPPADIQAALTVIGRRAHTTDVENLGGTNRSANLSEANLSKAYLFKANLTDANLSNAILVNANLSAAYLSAAYLSRADLSKANLTEADLSEANLSAAYLNEANLSKANLSEANLSKADLRGAENLTQVQLNKACGDASTMLPAGLTIKPCPPPPALKKVR